MLARNHNCECIETPDNICSARCARFYYKYKQCYLGEQFCLNGTKSSLLYESASGYRYCDINCYRKFQKMFKGLGDTLQYQLNLLSTRKYPNRDCLDVFLYASSVLSFDDFCCSFCKVPYDVKDKDDHSKWPVVTCKTSTKSNVGFIYKFECFSCFKVNSKVRDCVAYDFKKDIKNERWINLGFKYYDFLEDYYLIPRMSIHCDLHGRVIVPRKNKNETCPYCTKKKKLTKYCDNCYRTGITNPLKYIGFVFCSDNCYLAFKRIPYVDYLGFQAKHREARCGFTLKQKKTLCCSDKIGLLKQKLDRQNYKLKDHKKVKTDVPYCAECHVAELYETHFSKPLDSMLKGNITFIKKKDHFICLDCYYKNKKFLPRSDLYQMAIPNIDHNADTPFASESE